jgi:hypothetical protein
MKVGAPSLHIVILFEKSAPTIVPHWTREGDWLRLADWLEQRPELADLVDQALMVAEERAA